jgi:hypothetical protein
MVAAHYHGDGRMPNLDELDPTQPDGAIIKVAQLDDFIRETRQKLKAWALGDASDGEHHANGRHFIHQGSATSRDLDNPSPENGNLWVLTDGGFYRLQIYGQGSWHTIT